MGRNKSAIHIELIWTTVNGGAAIQKKGNGGGVAGNQVYNLCCFNQNNLNS